MKIVKAAVIKGILKIQGKVSITIKLFLLIEILLLS